MAYLRINILPRLVIQMLLIICGVKAKGTAELKFLNFSNPTGSSFDGSCCDYKSFWSSQCVDCNHMFKICIGNITQSSSMNTCEFGMQSTGAVKKNQFNFTSDIGGTQNPLKFSFNTWPNVMKIKIDVQDQDGLGTFDFIDHYEYQIFLTNLTNQIDSTRQELQLIGAISQLQLEIRVYCDDGYYGPRCDIHCIKRDDDGGHYTCDKVSGKKICNAGWSGEACMNNIDDCVGNRCSYGSICEDKLGFYTCYCLTGKTGTYCESEINECASLPCLNGGICFDGQASFQCICVANYTGSQCQQQISACDSSPCLNQATCSSVGNDSYSFICKCIEGYIGRFCEIPIDDCQQNNCTNGATCIDLLNNYVCQCVPGFIGSRCEIDIDECSSNPCLYDGICYNRVNNFKCDCPKETSGEMCQNLMTSTSVTLEHDSTYQYTGITNSSDVKSTEHQPADTFIPTNTQANNIFSIYTTGRKKIAVTQEVNKSETNEYGITTDSSEVYLDINNTTSTVSASKAHTMKYNKSEEVTTLTEDIHLTTSSNIYDLDRLIVLPTEVPVSTVTKKPLVVADCLVIKIFPSNKLNRKFSKKSFCWRAFDSILPPISKIATKYIENRNEAYIWLEETMNDLLPLPTKSTAVILNREEILSYLKNSIEVINNSSQNELSNSLVEISPCMQIWMKSKRRNITYLKTKAGDPNVQYKIKSNVNRRSMSSKMIYCKRNTTLAVTTQDKSVSNITTQTPILSQTMLQNNQTTDTPTLSQSTSVKVKTTDTPTLSQSTFVKVKTTDTPTLSQSTSVKSKTSDTPTLSQSTSVKVKTTDTPTLSQSTSVKSQTSDTPTLSQSTYVKAKTSDTPTLSQSTSVRVKTTDTPTLSQSMSVKVKTTDTPTLSQSTSLKNKTTDMPTLSQSISLKTKSTHTPTLSQSTSLKNKTTSPKETTTAIVRRFNILLKKINKTHYQERFSSTIYRSDNKPKMVLTVFRTAKRIYQLGSESANKVYRKTKLLLHMTLKQLSTIWISVKRIKAFAIQPIFKGQEAIRKTWTASWLKVNKAFSKTRQLIHSTYTLARNNFNNVYQQMKENSQKLSRDYYRQYYNYFNNYNKKINRVSGYFSGVYRNYTSNLQQYWDKYIKHENNRKRYR